MNTNDPKLTAYALGELDAKTRARVEAAIRRDARLAAAIEEIRGTARVVEAGLAGEALPRLTDAQRAAVLEAADGARVAGRIFKQDLRPGGFFGFAKVLGMAASLALIAGGMAGFGLWRASHLDSKISAPQTDLNKDWALAIREGFTNPTSQPGAPVDHVLVQRLIDKVGKAPNSGPAYTFTTSTVQPNTTSTFDVLASINPNAGDWTAVGNAPPASGGLSLGYQIDYARIAPNTASEKFSTFVSNPRASANNRRVLTSISKDDEVARQQLHSLGYVGAVFDGDGVADATASSAAEKVVEDVKLRLESRQRRDGQKTAVIAKLLETGRQLAAERRFGDAAEAMNEILFIDPQNQEAGALKESYNESYHQIVENPFLSVPADPLSTFSIDVDTGSYSNVRRMLNAGQMPPADAVRIEELLNYFSYNYAPPADDAPFAAHVEIAACPWEPTHRLARIGIKGREIAQENRPACNLVFLLDVSGSMEPAERLPLIKQALHLMVPRLRADDRVAIVTYAGETGVALASTPASNQQAILNVIDNLSADGGTNGASGIQLAYQQATASFIEGGINRVILATDGDFNVGVTSQDELVNLIQEEAKTGVFLTVLGVGMGNLKDSTLEKLADKGNGHYAYLDTVNEAKKVLVDEIGATLMTIAKDVKIQVEFNPATVAAYRLIGYEKRLLAAEDFNDDTKDAGEIGAGHTVTALYELIPADQFSPLLVEQWPANPMIDPLKYQTPAELVAATLPSDSRETLTLKLRYKAPDGDVSKLMEFPVTDGRAAFDAASEDFRFASSVAGFGMCLRNSPYRGGLTLEGVQELAAGGWAVGVDANGYRAEFLALVKRARQLAGN